MAGGISTLHDARATVQEAAGAAREEDAVREREREMRDLEFWAVQSAPGVGVVRGEEPKKGRRGWGCTD